LLCRWLLACAAGLATLWPLHVRANAAVEGELGLPFTRFYPFDEIGKVSRGARLGFDRLGRIAVSRAGSCVVLNDTTWIDLAGRTPGGPVMENLVFDSRGGIYFCAFGVWGTARITDGKIRPRPLVPENPPKWVATANFNSIVPVRTGVLFGSLTGLVYWDRATDRHTFLDVGATVLPFAIGENLFVSTPLHGLSRFDPATGQLVRLFGPEVPAALVDHAETIDESHALISDMEGRLHIFDGTSFAPFPGLLGARPIGRVSALCRMVDGHFAVAVNGAGLYLVARDGRVLTSLTTPEYHRVTDLAARENGVLWIVTETGIEKILYNSALTSFGQRQGLPVSWPQLVRWRGRIVVASGGRLYEAVDGRAGNTTRFQLMAGQPAAQVWGLATEGDELVVGTNQGVFARADDDPFREILAGVDAARLLPLGDALLVLGASEMAVIRREGGRWVECAPRIPGVGFPLIVHSTSRAAWIELGPNRAARVTLRDDQLRVRLFEDFPWKAPRWINIGWAGDTVALSGMPEGRLFFDEKTETFVHRPELAQALDAAPYPVLRFREDRDGLLWATHEDGLLTIRREGGKAVTDASTFGRLNDRFPLAQLLPGDDVWVVTGQSLYHVNRNFVAALRPAYHPRLTSLTNGRTERELLRNITRGSGRLTLPFEDNTLVARFFAGTYAGRQQPAYTFRLYRGTDSRVMLGNGSLLTLTDLAEGTYRLEANIAGTPPGTATPFSFAFTILPPWYRTWYAYSLYGIGAGLLVFGLVRWSVQRAHSRNVVLEQLVAERTEELRAAMRQLNEETRNAATFAERDRLAGEIHDSLQQGLSGLMLHLDATLKLPGLAADVRARLRVARNMVSFTRHEVQHAVWDMETPLLEGADLGEALHKIAALIGPGAGAAEVRITVTGHPADLPAAIKHHLLRIAQEAITNAVRHAAAHFITITLAYESGGVSLTVQDDGNGFVPGDVLNQGIGHFGLRGLRGRAGKIGGDFHLESAPGQGTTIRVTVRTSVPAI
jgi:signal transduction histidine kinase/ligand-binding sensor domain-containing protein